MAKPRIAKVKNPAAVRTLRVAKKPALPRKMRVQSDVGLVPPEAVPG